jgi:hypothetical protein
MIHGPPLFARQSENAANIALLPGLGSTSAC